MWAATTDYSPYLAIPAAVRFFKAYGPQNIFAHNHTLVCWAAEALALQWNTKVLSPRQDCGTTACVKLPTELGERYSAAEVVLELRRRNVEAMIFEYANNLWIRLSAHVYNQRADYARVSEAVSDIVASLGAA